MTTIKNLVFEGGGVKGVAYAGALSVLEEHSILKNIERVAGTSAGAITSCLVAMQMGAEQVGTIVKGMDLSQLEDHENPVRTFKHYGIHPGDALLDWVKQIFKDQGLSSELNFRDFQAKGFKDLHVFASDIYAHKVQEFSAALTPDTIVAEAVRASMSIPLFFNAWKFSNNQPNNHLYVDGGMVYNYPITAFDKDDSGEVNEETLGFRLEDINGNKEIESFGYGHWVAYVKNTFETLMRSQTIMYRREINEIKRSVVIDDLGIPATDFKLSEKKKEALIEEGAKATNAYLKNQ